MKTSYIVFLFFGAFFSHSKLLAKDKWILIMDGHLEEIGIIHLMHAINDIHNIKFIREKGVYVLLEADDSTKLSVFYNECINMPRLVKFPFGTYNIEDNLGTAREDDYTDTLINPDFNGQIFNINGRWMNYINTDGRTFSRWLFATNHGEIEGKFVQYNKNRELLQYINYENGVKDGYRLSLRMNGDTICFGQYKQGRRIKENCYHEDKTPFIYESQDEKILKIWFTEKNEKFYTERQIDSLGHLNGQYKKKNSNNVIIETGQYIDNNMEGVWKYYNNMGELMKTEKYAKGNKI